MATIPELLKNHATAIAAIFSTIATIGGAVLYVENNYASARDIKEVSQTQQQQIKVQTIQQRQMSLFQLEYYDDKIRKLQEEKRIAEERERTRTQNRAVSKTSTELQEEITDIKKRRDLVRKSLEE